MQTVVDQQARTSTSTRRPRICVVRQETNERSDIQYLNEPAQAAVERERQRLSRDLHDAVSQQLFSASLISEVLPQIWAGNPAKGAEYLEDLRLLTKGALAEMRALLVELRPTALIDTPLPELLQHLVTALAGRTRIQVELQVKGEGHLSGDVQLAFYRLAQEALNNIAKHANARSVVVALRLADNEAELAVHDDGRGFDTATTPTNHFGLAIMRERMEQVGGTLVVASEAGQGTMVVARWPGW